MRLILSPVGTSLLTNIAGEERQVLYAHANTKRSEVPAKVERFVMGLAADARARLASADDPAQRRLSAEMNGIHGLYAAGPSGESNDIHYLITTDTFQGELAAEVLKDHLRKRFPNTQVYVPEGLQACEKSAFLQGMKSLVRWCHATLPGYRQSGYEVVFNLTGGFKSLQGFLNTIGMFHADRIIYIFETGEDLITIPRLPIQLEMDLFEQHAATFLQLQYAPDGLHHAFAGEIPEIMVDRIGDRCLLSAWGELVWDHAKSAILPEGLVELPWIEYSAGFRKDFSRHPSAQEKVRLQEEVALVSCLLQDSRGDISCLKGGRGGGLLYDNYFGVHRGIGHFRISQDLRVSCTYSERKFTLRHFGGHDYVNDNP